MADKVVFAESDITVHRVVGSVSTDEYGNKHVATESHTLLPGDTFPFDQLPFYQQEAASKGEIRGLKVMSSEDVSAEKARVDQIRASLLGDANVISAGYSAHEVPDEVLTANLQAQAQQHFSVDEVSDPLPVGPDVAFATPPQEPTPEPVEAAAAPAAVFENEGGAVAPDSEGVGSPDAPDVVEVASPAEAADALAADGDKDSKKPSK